MRFSPCDDTRASTWRSGVRLGRLRRSYRGENPFARWQPPIQRYLTHDPYSQASHNGSIVPHFGKKAIPNHKPPGTDCAVTSGFVRRGGGIPYKHSGNTRFFWLFGGRLPFVRQPPPGRFIFCSGCTMRSRTRRSSRPFSDPGAFSQHWRTRR